MFSPDSDFSRIQNRIEYCSHCGTPCSKELIPAEEYEYGLSGCRPYTRYNTKKGVIQYLTHIYCHNNPKSKFLKLFSKHTDYLDDDYLFDATGKKL